MAQTAALAHNNDATAGQSPIDASLSLASRGPVMDAAYIRHLIMTSRDSTVYYLTPELNRCLYLHFKGFKSIGGLEDYVGLKELWLESNAITRIQGLGTLAELRHLYLQQNCIERIEGLEGLGKLDTLNVSNNFLRRVEGLGPCAALTTLIMASNSVVLDLTDNKIDDPSIVEVFEKMPNLRVLTLSGNSVVSAIPSYRRTLVSRLKQLTYLDDMPVFPKERRLAEAWAVGGHEAEMEERKRIAQEDRDRERRNFEALEALIRGDDAKLANSYEAEQEEDRKARMGEKKPAASEALQSGTTVAAAAAAAAPGAGDVVVTDFDTGDAGEEVVPPLTGSDAEDDGQEQPQNAPTTSDDEPQYPANMEELD
eukprot:m51a1_g3936 putative dynein assembly factor axonemal (368) ;mRNA; f:249018-250399